MTAPIAPRLPTQAPPPPFAQERSTPPATDTVSQRRYEDEKKLLWEPLLGFLFAKIPGLTKLWTTSIRRAPLSAENLHLVAVPKFIPKSAQKACAGALGSEAEQVIAKAHFSCIEAISILPLPDLSASPAAENQISTVLAEKIKQTGQEKKYALGWATDRKALPTQDEPRISKLFIDAFIASSPPHTDLTLESLPANKGGLARLVESLQTTETLRLSTTIESELTGEFIEALEALPSLKTLIFKHPEGLPVGSLKKTTWERLNPFLNTPSLNVELDRVLPPKPTPPWHKKITAQLGRPPVQAHLEKPGIKIGLEQKI